jgi:predicted dehydrogenase
MLKFGTLGAANITPQALIYPCINEPHAAVTLIAARSRADAEGFAKYHHISRVAEDYQAVIDDDRIDAVYVPLAITDHKQWSIKALQAGKHVLCEKSFASNANEAKEMAAVASRQNLIIMDAFHYRYHPLFHKARDVYQSGRLGKIIDIDARFHVPRPPSADDIRMMYETGGGVTMDIGCYPISWLRHITGLEPTDIQAQAEVGPTNVDLYLTTEMMLPGGITARTSGDMRGGQFVASLKVTGDAGSMTLNNPLAPQIGHSLVLDVNDKQTTQVFDRRPSYCYQLDAFLQAVASGKQPLTGADDAVRQMQVIDQCYEAAGLPIRGL